MFLMSNQMELVVTLRKAVADRDEGVALFNLVKTRLEDKPEVIISGHVTNHFSVEEPT